MFTKLHKEERQLLFKTNSAVAYEVYMHLKDKYSYFKTECYDLRRCIAEYLDIPERTVKDAIKRLKKVGLITTKLNGKVNMYSFPILDKIEGKTNKEENETISMENETEQLKTIINEEYGEGFISDEEKYGEEVMTFLDFYDREVFNALNAVVDYYYFKNESQKMLAEGANKKINQMAKDAGLVTFTNLEQYCTDYIEDRKNRIRLEQMVA
jgi:hypothetical protein